MEGKEIKQQINTWFDEKLKNPYFGAVAAVWIITNRVVFFSLFNFDSDLSLQDRIAFIHTRLQSARFLWFEGFYATVAWAFVWGLGVMLVADQVNTIAKALYKFGHKSKNYLLQRIEPSKWMETSEHIDIEQKNIKLEKDVKSQRIELNREEKEHEEVQKLYSEALKSLLDKDSFLTAKDQSLKVLEDQVRQYTEERKKFKVLFARYGQDNKFVEVTKTVFDLIVSKGSFTVTNDVLGFDPYPSKVKELVVEYEVDAESKTLSAVEGSNIDFINGILETISTSSSLEHIKWVVNQEKLADIMAGPWELEWIKDGKSTIEAITIDAKGNYYIDGMHTFNLLVKDLDDNRIVLEKIYIDGKLKSTETLSYQNDGLTGTDTDNCTLIYKPKPISIQS